MQHTNLLLESIYNKSLSVRLGLLSPDHQSLLLVLPTQLGSKASSKDASGERGNPNPSLHPLCCLYQLPNAHTAPMQRGTVAASNSSAHRPGFCCTCGAARTWHTHAHIVTNTCTMCAEDHRLSILPWCAPNLQHAFKHPGVRVSADVPASSEATPWQGPPLVSALYCPYLP
jgi:hypothetical protein